METNLKDLKKRIKNFKNRNKLPFLDNKRLQNSKSSLSICIELVSTVIVGLIIGLFLDKILHTNKPYALIICLIFSVMAGLKIILTNYI